MAMGLKEKIPGVLEISLGPHVQIGANDRTGGMITIRNIPACCFGITTE